MECSYACIFLLMRPSKSNIRSANEEDVRLEDLCGKRVYRVSEKGLAQFLSD